jgi:curli biogenesis system outer membrane secretion channel CsgG
MRHALVRSCAGLALALSLAAGAFAQDGPEAPAPRQPAKHKVSLAVFPLGWNVGTLDSRNRTLLRLADQLDSAALTTRFVHALVKSGKFDVVDREHMNRYLGEMDLGDRGILDPERAVRAGKAIGADYFLMGDVRAFKVQTLWKPVPYSKKGMASRIVTARLAADLRIVDTRTSRIVAANTIEATIRHTRQVPNEFLPEGPTVVEIVNELRSKLAAALVRGTVDEISPLRTTAAGSDVVILNRGAADGLVVGQIYNVFGTGKDEVLDLDTGKPAGDQTIKIGQIRVTEVLAQTSRAAVLGGAVLPAGAVCRPVPPAAPTSRPADGAKRGPKGW